MSGVTPVPQVGAVNVRTFGAKGDGTTDDAAAFSAAITAARAQGAHLIVPYRANGYVIGSTIQVNNPGLVVRGVRGDRGANSGTQLIFTGTGPLFQVGTDDGLAYDRKGYDGVGALELRNLSIKTTTAATVLANGQGNYKAGTYAVRDWRGGDIILEHVLIENFEYGFWGIQSDLNLFSDVKFRYCKTGCYLGPRSDQALFQGGYSFFNDTVVQVDGAWGVRFHGTVFVGNGSYNGSTYTYPITIGSNSWSRGANDVSFVNCWFEHLQGETSELEAFVAIGLNDANQCRGISFINPIILTGVSPSYHVKYLAKIGNAYNLNVIDPGGAFVQNLTKLLWFDGNYICSGSVRMDRARYEGWAKSAHDSTNSAAPEISYQLHGFSASTVASKSGRLYFYLYGQDLTREFFISSEGGGSRFLVRFPGITNPDWIDITRRFKYGTAAPTTGTYAVGDRVINQAPSELGTAGSKYVLNGWVCTAAGTPGSWLEQRTLTGN